jgi:uncharacterized membrane protein YgcG
MRGLLVAAPRTRLFRAIALAGLGICTITVAAPAAVYEAKFPLLPPDVERELCLDRKAGPTEAYLHLPIPSGWAGGNAPQNSAYASLKQAISPAPLFIEYGPAMRLAKPCCPASTDQLQSHDAPAAENSPPFDEPLFTFSKLPTTPAGLGDVFLTTLSLTTFLEDDVRSAGCSAAAWASGGMDSRSLIGSSLGGAASGGSGSGVGGGGGGGGSEGSAGGAWGSNSVGVRGQSRPGSDETTPLFPLIPLVTVSDTPSEPKVGISDLLTSDPEDRVVITPPHLKAVPGPIAGAGLPALLALGGFVWARRRKAAAA